jgi:hypothetical protein
MMLCSQRIVGLVLFAGLLLGCTKSQRPPGPDEVVRQVAAFYKAKRTMRVDTQATVQSQMPGMQNTANVSRALAFERPNRLSVLTQGGMGGVDVLSDGSKLITSVPMLKTYTEANAPPSIDELSDNPSLAMMGAGGGMFVLALLSSDPYTKIMEGVNLRKYEGLEKLDGIDVHHLRFTQNQMGWELWVQAGVQPLVLQVKMDLSRQLAGTMKQLGQSDSAQVSVILTERFQNWRFDETLPPSTFVFTPPTGSKKQERLFGGLLGKPPSAESSPLLGKPARP